MLQLADFPKQCSDDQGTVNLKTGEYGDDTGGIEFGLTVFVDQ